MKNSTKKILITVIFVTVISFVVNAQTNVSGGIFSNTTWTLANSPYIVTDTIVVFPNVTLTIEPGVVVKFDSAKYMELRQASLIALGTVTDSITFTSNSVSPYPGIWQKIIATGTGSHTCRFDYCNFKYGTKGFTANSNPDSMFVKHSKFERNVTGFYGGQINFIDSCQFLYNTQVGIEQVSNVFNCLFIGNNHGINSLNSTIKNCMIDSNQLGIFGFIHSISNCIIRNNLTGISNLSGHLTIDSCTINKNQTGAFITGNTNLIKNSIVDSNNIVGIKLYGNGTDGSTIINCQIQYNGTGVSDSLCVGGVITKNQIEYNNIGIVLATYQDTVYCNIICSNTTCALKYVLPNNTNCVVNNYWCTSDSASTEAVIYDGYDNILYGLVSFMPIDTVQCYSVTGIPIYSFQNKSLNIFPNPFSDNLNVSINENDLSEIILYDITSRKLLQQTFTNSITLNTAQLAKGIYLYEVRNKNGPDSYREVKKGKVVKE